MRPSLLEDNKALCLEESVSLAAGVPLSTTPGPILTLKQHTTDRTTKNKFVMLSKLY